MYSVCDLCIHQCQCTLLSFQVISVYPGPLWYLVPYVLSLWSSCTPVSQKPRASHWSKCPMISKEGTACLLVKVAIMPTRYCFSCIIIYCNFTSYLACLSTEWKLLSSICCNKIINMQFINNALQYCLLTLFICQLKTWFLSWTIVYVMMCVMWTAFSFVCNCTSRW